MRRKLMAGALALAMVGSLVACGGGEKKAASEGESKEAATTAQSGESKSGEKKHYKFGYTCMDGTNPFFVTIQDKIKEMVEANGDELIVTDPGMHPALCRAFVDRSDRATARRHGRAAV